MSASVVHPAATMTNGPAGVPYSPLRMGGYYRVLAKPPQFPKKKRAARRGGR